MKKLFIHIGTHKTGSTFLQKALKNNKENLRLQSVHYAKEFYSIFIKENINSFFQHPKCDTQALQENLDKLSQVEEERIVISYEGLAGALTLLPPHIYFNSRQNAEMLKRISSKFDTYIIIATRRQDFFIESAYHQMLKWGTHKKFSAFLEKNIDHEALNWSKLIDKYAQLFSAEKVFVLPYELCIDNSHAFFTEFFDIFSNSDYLDKKLNTIINPSYSRKAMHIALLLNRYLNQQQKATLRKILQRRMPKKPGTQLHLFNDEQRTHILQRHQEDNERLFRKYLKKFDNEYYLGKSKTFRYLPR